MSSEWGTIGDMHIISFVVLYRILFTKENWWILKKKIGKILRLCLESVFENSYKNKFLKTIYESSLSSKYSHIHLTDHDFNLFLSPSLNPCLLVQCKIGGRDSHLSTPTKRNHKKGALQDFRPSQWRILIYWILLHSVQVESLNST